MRDDPRRHERFIAQYPEYLTTVALDRARASDYHRLDAHQQAGSNEVPCIVIGKA